MDATAKRGQVVFTNKARCRDCYRCLRVCPVKAIRMHDGQAFVVEERCISCGTCIRECPQGAKTFRNDVSVAARLVGDDAGPVAASVAPSFAAYFNQWQRRRLPSALRKLGFTYVAETAVGAYPVARRTEEIVAAAPDRSHICTACPAAVRYVERYRPDLVPALTPAPSPMVAHASIIKRRLGREARVVFIGPCVAKKAEAERDQFAGLVDCVLTFAELTEWLESRGIALSGCEESDFDDRPCGDARYFPLVGGEARTGTSRSDLLDRTRIATSGFEEFREALDGLTEDATPVVIEPLFCPVGCVNGPAMAGEVGLYERRDRVLAYASETPGATGETADASLAQVRQMKPTFEAGPPSDETIVSEDDIRRALEMTGKGRPEDQLNCGACGYATCRAKAVAVVRGMAEPEMCLPYMKRQAERRTDRIIETSPNGIVILDEQLNILSMNPAFRRFFMSSEAVCGKRISYLMDPEPFERLAAGTERMIEVTVRHDRYHMVCHQILYALPEDRQYVGIFVNITRSLDNQRKLDNLRATTAMQAQELLEHQIAMAQKIAQFLGESTAQGQQLVENLLRLTENDARKPAEKGAAWIWRTSTST
ncbi:MAG: PAS domain S-box protein [Planctomycetes bacterium]|nr:PAS domain S-box protein [Planctomycetota bacterium]